MGIIDSINQAGLRTNAISFFGYRGRDVNDWIAAGYTAQIEPVRKGLFGWKTRYQVTIADQRGTVVIQGETKKLHNANRFARSFNDASRATRS